MTRMPLSGLQFTPTTLKPIVIVFMVALPWPSLALSDSVPQNLASMARSLLLGVEADLKQTTGEETQDTIRKRARSILRQARIRNWSRKPARQGATTTEPTQTHEMLVGDNDERLELKWDRQANKFSIRIKANETSSDARDDFDLQLTGKVTAQPYGGDGDAILDIQPDEKAISVITSEELKVLRASIFGKWRDQEGDVWEISKASADTNDPDAAHRLEKQIEELSRQIANIKRDTVYVWRNSDTNETIRLEKPKQLDDPFVYVKKEFRNPAAKERLAVLENQLEELRTKSKPLPVDASDPIGMKKMRASGDAQPLIIRVTDKDGYSWTYDAALFSNGRITAKRTLRSIQDAKGMKYQDVARQLIASWSPPEWIELEVSIQHEPRKVSLSGHRWRMRWTADADDHRVKSIHTPYSRELLLEDDKPKDNEVELRLVDADGKIISDDRFSYGEVFILQAVYRHAPAEPPESINLTWNGGNAAVRLHPTGDDDTVFVSRKLKYLYDKKVILELEVKE